MRSIVINFFQLEILNLHPIVYWGLAGVWVLLLVSALMSVRSLSISTGVKFLWALIIIALPILGLAVYAIRCLIRSNWQAIMPVFQSRKMDRQLSSVGVSANTSKKA